ncbi:MAG: hypothetical protein ACI8QC_002235 [Planctomycetota bacterium]|jgi:hypothetical protein
MLPWLGLAWLGLMSAGAGTRAADINWERSYEAALERAKTQGLVLFVAVNMDGDVGNDRMAKKVYHNRTVVGLATQTVNLVASIGLHDKGGDCRRLGAITCDEHRDIDVDVRTKILKANEGGFVVAPQHVWLAPDGAVLLSVPYEVSAGELEWCFHEAQRRINPDYAGKESSKSRRPRRWIPGGVSDPEAAENGRPVTREEALEIISDLKKGGIPQAKMAQLYLRLAKADLEEARDAIQKFLRSGGGARAGGGGKGGGKGGGGGGGRGQDLVPKMIRAIGEVSPRSYWEVLEDFVSTGDARLRTEAVVAMEQLAAPEAVSALSKQYKKEREPEIKKNILRALGACGSDSQSVRSLLLKASVHKKDGLLRQNALIGMGWLEPNEDVQERLKLAFESGSALEQSAALVAMGLSRDTYWLESLEQTAGERGEFQELAAKVVSVLKQGQFRILAVQMAESGVDVIPRNRLFRRSRKPADADDAADD